MYGVSRKEKKLKAANEKNKNNIEKGGLPMPLALPQPNSDDLELKINENGIHGIKNKAFVEDEHDEKDENSKVINEAIEIVKELPTIHVESYRLWYIFYLFLSI